jgi:hypothetical protein
MVVSVIAPSWPPVRALFCNLLPSTGSLIGERSAQAQRTTLAKLSVTAVKAGPVCRKLCYTHGHCGCNFCPLYHVTSTVFASQAAKSTHVVCCHLATRTPGSAASTVINCLIDRLHPLSAQFYRLTHRLYRRELVDLQNINTGGSHWSTHALCPVLPTKCTLGWLSGRQYTEGLLIFTVRICMLPILQGGNQSLDAQEVQAA